MCPERVREIDARRPGAARFFLVHEYGHLALRTREEALADEWAAKQLAAVPIERATLREVLFHFADEGTVFDPLYGTGFDRGLCVARAAGIPEREWPDQLLAYAKSEGARAAGGALLTIRMPEGYVNAAQMIIYLDRQPVGFLSNMDQHKPLDLPKLAPGRHLLQAARVWLYHAESTGTKTEVGRELYAEDQFDSTGKTHLSIEFRFDDATLAIQVEELR